MDLKRNGKLGLLLFALNIASNCIGTGMGIILGVTIKPGMGPFAFRNGICTGAITAAYLLSQDTLFLPQNHTLMLIVNFNVAEQYWK